MYASVIVDIENANVDRTFCYKIPDGMSIEPGHRVLVPFGTTNRKIEGFVVSVSDECPDSLTQVKTIIKALEPYTVMLEDQLKLAEWITGVYRCLYVDALRLMIPAQLRGGRVKEKVIRQISISPGLEISKAEELLKKKDGTYRSKTQGQIFELLIRHGKSMSIQELSACVTGAAPAVKALIDKGILVEEGREKFRSPFDEGIRESKQPELTEQQVNAYEKICDGIDNRSGMFLLHGVTGSGKTEVYMRSIAYAIEQDGTAIMLVPEISLTPQTVNRFRSRFGDRIAVLHSRLSPGERFDEWRRIRLGMVKVVIGARSAVFAPLSNIRLIVIDEEHEPSYQSESLPRYNAIDIAIRRCKLSGAALVLGSATPSLTDYLKARRNIYCLIEMNDRISNIPMPLVEVVDMREEFMAGNTGVFSHALKQSLTECIDRDEQAILFINRRGYSTFVSCRACGYVFECDSCDVSMTYHSVGDVLKCHYCGSTKKLPTKCPQCGAPYIKYFGIGTQQVEEQLKELIPDCRILRMDMDTTSTKGSHAKILRQFEEKQAQVLVGTQMIAKGLDIPNVTLVGVVAADSMLHIPDFRSSERTFQLLTQVAGRAGRKEKQGKVIVQTFTPENEVIRFASMHDFKGFYEYEIAQRRRSLFPPYSLFVRVLFMGDSEGELFIESERYAKGITEAINGTLDRQNANKGELLMVDAAPAPVKRKHNLYRYQVLLRFARTKNLPTIIKAIYAYHKDNRGEFAMMPEINPNDMF